MFTVKSVVFSLLLASSGSYAEQRKLSGQKFGTYETRTSVSDHAAIAYDQQEMESLLSKKTEAELSAAQKVYEEGGNSKSYAELALTEGLADDVKKGAEITGQSANGDTVTGAALEEADAGDLSLKVQYRVGEVLTDHVDCRVGGLTSGAQELTGCLADTGTVNVDGQGSPVGYTYTQTSDNKNARTLQGFTLQAGAKMTGFKDFEAFKAYYGYDDYADRWIQAAFNGERAQLSNGVADWSSATKFDGRNEAIKKGSSYMSVAMYVIRELEDAIVDCQAGCGTDECNADAVNALDEAAAFYYGATWDQTDEGGHLQYALAQKRCKNFGTCGPTGDGAEGTAKINLDITSEMNIMKDRLNKGECSAAIENKEKIVNLMKVPLIQGVLRYAYITDPSKGSGWTEKGEAEGATFAAALLPWVAECNPDDAATVYNNMKVGQGGTADYNAVRTALENNYNCMVVSCKAVGGLRDENVDPSFGITHYEGTAPCTFSTVADSGAWSVSVVSATVIAAIGSAFALLL